MARIQVSHLTFAYEGSPDLIFDDASFQVDTDWKLGFIGRNGRGKTTLLRILAGELPASGAVSSPVPAIISLSR
jgi:lincosamide and streptogramin A transport system ATP-binding/permease protein